MLADCQHVGNVLSRSSGKCDYPMTDCCCVCAQGSDQIAWQVHSSGAVLDAVSISPLAPLAALGGEAVLIMTHDSLVEGSNNADSEDWPLR